MQCSNDHWSTEVWNDKGQEETAQMTQKQWNLLWKGEETFRKCTKALGSTGVDVQPAPQEPFPDHQKATCLPSMLRDRQENTIGKPSFRILLPLNLSGVKEEEQKTLQEWLLTQDLLTGGSLECGNRRLGSTMTYGCIRKYSLAGQVSHRAALAGVCA
jgi:hypothetical protein